LLAVFHLRRCRLGVAQGQDTHREQAVGGVVIGEMPVDGAGHAGGECGFLILGHTARSGGEQHCLLDVVIVEELVPDRDLFIGLGLAAVAAGHCELAPQVRVPGLAARPQVCIPALPAVVEIGAHLVLVFHNMAIGIDGRNLRCHCGLPFLRWHPVEPGTAAVLRSSALR